MKTVTIDAGHGGHDSGAIHVSSGLKESDMALDVCLRMEKLLSDYVNVVMTRSDDVFLSLTERYQIANDNDSDAFLSYHFNSGSSPNTAPSWEIFSTKGQNNSDKLATCVGNRHGDMFPNQGQRTDYSDGDLDKEANFTVIKGTYCPSSLMEGEFIHTDHGAKFIRNPKNRQRMAVAASQGLLDFLGVVNDITYEGGDDKPVCPTCGQVVPSK